VTLGLAALLLPFGTAGSLDRAEVYFLDAARAMADGGDWLVPHYRHEPFFDKPILTYWLIALAFKMLGPTAEAGRMVAAAASLVALLLTITLGTLLCGRRAGLFAGVMLATTLPFARFGRIAMSDTLMTVWGLAAIVLAVLAYGPPRRPWLLAGVGAALGLGFATKGPVAVLLPGLALVALAWSRRKERSPLAFAPLVTGAALGLVIGLGWFVALYVRLGLDPLRYFFLRENLQRFAASTYDSAQGPWYYFVTYLAEGAPWSLFLIPALLALRRARSREEGATARWLGLALLLMVLPLTASRGKIDYYLLPLYPLASVVVGVLFARTWRALEKSWARVVTGLFALGAVGAVFLSPRLPGPWLPSHAVRDMITTFAVVCALGLAFVTWRPSPTRVAAALALPVAGFFAIFLYVWAPAFHAAQPNDAIVADVARENLHRPDAWLALCDDDARILRDIIFETPIVTLDTCEVWAVAASPQPYLLLLHRDEWRSLHAQPGIRYVGEYRYLPANALSLRSLLERPSIQKAILAANFRTRDPEARQRERQWERELRRRTERSRRAAAAGPAVFANPRNGLYHRAGCPNAACPDCTQRFENAVAARAAGFRPADCCGW
jgi:4-amino-4-deoxy-L-arabinose transferase-like glycosyltransferase